MQRLKTKAQFEAVMANGSTVARTAHFALHRMVLATGSGPESQALFAADALFQVRDVYFGTVLPKRWAKRAVTRNTIKRQVHALTPAFEDRLPAAAHVVRLRAAFDRTQFLSPTSDVLKRAVRGELQTLLERSLQAQPA